MNRVVMPLFDFVNSDEREFVFGDGRYALRKFRPNRDIPNVPGLSEIDVKNLKSRQWALVAEDGDAPVYKEDINRLLLSFKIHTLGKLFIKYRLCSTNHNLCKIIDQRMTYVRREKSPCKISLSQLSEVNVGFERLQEMDAVKGASNRTHNAIFFMYCAYFSSGHASNLFVLLFVVLEALFSKESRSRDPLKVVCQRASAFLGSQPRCTFEDVKKLYRIRSELVHGRRKATGGDENLDDAHELEFVVTECMKKMLSERIYLKYEDEAAKEAYFNQLTSASRHDERR